MRSILQRRFQWLLGLALVAAAAVTILTVAMVITAIQHAEGFILSDTTRTLDRAIAELKDPSALAAGLSQHVLSAYPGVEGGFWSNGQFIDYSYPTHDASSAKLDVPPAERPEIESVIAEAVANGSSRRVLRGKHDLVVVSASAMGPKVAWTMKRLPGQAESSGRSRTILTAALVAIALLGVAGVLATALGLRRGVDEELRREERIRSIGKLVGQIAHEMRNPLNSIRLSLQMLSRRQEENRLHPGDFQIAIDEVDRMNRLLSDLLAFQQPRPAKIESRRLGPILDDCRRLVMPHADRAGVRLVVADRSDTAALVDEQYFRQIVVNLLLNAIEVSPRIEIDTVRAGGGIAVQVSDHGPGLTSEQQEHLFEPFYTTKSNGHGLGLAVSRELAQTMGGELRYVPRAGTGATFVLHLRGSHAG